MQKTEIDGFTFELEQLPAWDHAEASMRLVRIVGGGIVPLTTLLGKFDGMKDGKLKTTPELDLKLVGVIINLLQNAQISEVMTLAKMILKGCVVGGDLPGNKKLGQLEPIFDQLFRGKSTTVFKLIAWAIKVNFADFFGELQSVMPARKSSSSQAPASPSTSPNPSEEDGPAADSSPTAGQLSPS